MKRALKLPFVVLAIIGLGLVAAAVIEATDNKVDKQVCHHDRRLPDPARLEAGERSRIA